MVEDRYVLQTTSRYFPTLDLQAIVTETLKLAYDRNTSVALQALRRQVQSGL